MQWLSLALLLGAALADPNPTWNERRDCGLGDAYDRSTARYLAETPQEIIASIFAPVAILAVLLVWSGGSHFSSRPGAAPNHLANVAVYWAAATLFIGQRLLYLVAPTEFAPAEDNTDLSNLIVSSVAGTLALAWVAQYVLSDGSVPAEAQERSKRWCCSPYRWSRLANYSRISARILALAAWLMDINHRVGQTVAIIGYLGFGIAVLVAIGTEVRGYGLRHRADGFDQMTNGDLSCGRLVYFWSFMAAGLLTAVQVLRPCTGYPTSA